MATTDISSATTPDTSAAPLERQMWGRVQWLASALVSLIVAAPCLLQRRIEACDLGSHLYNVWLVQLVRAGKAPGVTIHSQWSNTLFDRLLELSVSAFGFAGGEKVATVLALLVFFWGLFALASAAADEPAWKVAPLIAVFSYGWVFSMGLMNMYLSLGLMFAALAIVHKARGWQLLWLAPLLVLITLAHLIGTAGVLGVGALLAFLRWKHGWRGELGGVLFGTLAVFCLLRWVMASLPVLGAAPDVSGKMGGFDQLVLYSSRYKLAAAAVMVAVFVVLCHTILQDHIQSFGRVRLWLLLFASVLVLLPFLPNGFVTKSQGMVGMIPQRVSLIAAALLCCAMAGVARRWWHCGLLGLSVLPFFFLYYQNTQSLNRLEQRMEAVVKQLPEGIRLTTSINLPPQISRVSCTHLLDQACIGHCYNYGNYEPGSGQFRVRAVRENSIVTASWMDAINMEDGRYLPRKSEQPLYILYLCGSNPEGICVAPLRSREDAPRP